jgi:hypothetical protein
MKNRQTPEFLMNTKTGVVFVKTEILAARKDMVPYDFEKKQPVSAIGEPEPLPAASEEAEQEKERVAALVKEWFGRDVSRVSKIDLVEYAKDQFDIDLEDDTKLKMALAIEAAKEDL